MVKAKVKPEQIYIDLGKAIAAYRRSCGLSQNDVACAISINKSTVSMIERGRSRVYAHQLVRLAALFAVDVRSFFPDKEN